MTASRKHRVIAAGFRVIRATRADRWLAPVARGRGLILMFHHVRPAFEQPFAPNALLSVTPHHLDRTIAIGRELGFEFVPLDEVPARLSKNGPPFAAITFDDGYRDNVEHARPVLARHGVPWTMFVTADYASGRGRLWWLELEEVVRRLDGLTLPSGRVLASRTPGEKRDAFAQAYGELRAGPEERLRDAIAGWCREAGLDPSRLVRENCLGWAELRDLAGDRAVTIGAHTLSHPMLRKHNDATARREIRESRAVIRDRLGIDPRHIAYPVGDPGSAGAREFRLAAEAGYLTGVTTRPGQLFAPHAQHLTALPRVSVNGLFQTEDAVRALYSGVPFLAWNRGRRVNVD